MTNKLCHIKWGLLERVKGVKQFFRFVWDRILACSIGKPKRYCRLPLRPNSLALEAIEANGTGGTGQVGESCGGYETDEDLVTLKISLLGDCQIGKTSFVV